MKDIISTVGKNTQLDVLFYKQFYNLSGTESEIMENYLTEGINKRLMPNLEYYANILAILLDFDIDVFISNASFSNDLTTELIKHNHSDKCNDLIHFFNLYYGDITSTNVEDIQKGQLYQNRYRLLNSSELLLKTQTWDNLFATIKQKLNFDPEFYLFFYGDLKNPNDPLLDWLTDGIYKGYHPNIESFNSNKNCLQSLMESASDVDFNFILKTYPGLIEIVKSKTNLNDLELSLYTFFNYGRAKNLFWNENKKNEYVNEKLTKFINTVNHLKNKNSYSIDELIKINKENKNKQETLYTNAKNKIQPLVKKFVLDNKNHIMVILSKILNKNNITTFININKLKDVDKKEVLNKLLTIALNNFFGIKTSDIDVNSMKIKEFVLSFFYNGLLEDKSTMNKEEYLKLIKDYSISFLSQINIDNQLIDNISKDLDLLITSKNIIKLTKIITQLSLFASKLI